MTQNELMASLELASANQPFKRWKRGQVIDWVQDVVEDLIDKVELDPEETVATVKVWYDKVIRPIDIPGLPNFGIEPIVDEAVWRLIEFGIRQIFKRRSV